MESAGRTVELRLAVRAAFLLLLLRDFLRFGWMEGAPSDSLKMADEGVSVDSMAGRRGAGGVERAAWGHESSSCGFHTGVG